MEWSSKLLEYRDKVSKDIRNWMNGIPPILPTGVRKRILTRRFESVLNYTMSKYERRLTPQEFQFLRDDTSKNFQWIVNNLPNENLEYKKKLPIFVKSKK